MDNQAIIHVMFYIDRKKIHFTTKVSCKISDWNEKSQKIKSSDKDYSDKNLILSTISGRINNVIVKYRLKDRKLTREIFMKHYNRPDDYSTFYEFCDEYIKKTRKRIDINTLRTNQSALKKLQEYKPDLYFDDINTDFLEDYLVHIKKQLHNNDNTAHKNMSVIRKFVLAAIREGYMEENPFSDFKVKQSKPNIVFLEEAELKRFYHLYLSTDIEPKYRATLQLFLYMCFGSQHVGDAREMTIEQFTNVSFSYYRKKLKGSKPVLVTVPISNTLRKLLSDIIGDRKKGYLFQDLPADQTMNEYLKEIAKRANVNKPVTHKTGRHTFATIFLEYNPNPRTLQDILGHSDIKQTMCYVHALARTKQRGISCFDQIMK